MSALPETEDVVVETKKTYCRFCHNYCAMEVDIVDGKPIAVRGDVSDPVYGGYTCIKGRQLVEVYEHESRITQPLKKLPDGNWQEISMEQALAEIAPPRQTKYRRIWSPVDCQLLRYLCIPGIGSVGRIQGLSCGHRVRFLLHVGDD